jgi:hypothetical protein
MTTKTGDGYFLKLKKKKTLKNRDYEGKRPKGYILGLNTTLNDHSWVASLGTMCTPKGSFLDWGYMRNYNIHSKSYI